jgi:hypothetical protein
MADWVVDALGDLGGTSHFIEIAKKVYAAHEADFRVAGDYFYKWQYEMRWAGDLLVKQRRMIKDALGRRGVWSLRNAP